MTEIERLNYIIGCLAWIETELRAERPVAADLVEAARRLVAAGESSGDLSPARLQDRARKAVADMRGAARRPASTAFGQISVI